MKNKKMFLLFTFASTLFCVVTATAFSVHSKGNFQLKANQTEYDLVLNSSNAPSELNSTYDREVTSTVNTNLGNQLTFKFYNAISLNNGYVKLGNHGTMYCSTDGNDHISGLMQINANFSNGSLKLISSYNDGPAFVTDEHILSNNVSYTLPDNANSFVLEAQDAYVDISSISLRYSCTTNTKSFDTTKLYSVENFENYTADGIGYDGSHGINSQTNLRAGFYSVYYGSGTNPLSGSGWQKMGSTDYLTYNANKGRNNSKTALFKSNNSNYFMYIQRQYYYGIPTPIGQGNQLSVWMHGAYSNTSATTNSTYDAVVTIVAYYGKKFNNSGENQGTSETFYVPAGSDWHQYTVDLDPSKPVYGYAIHIAKGNGTIYLPVDDIEIYTTNPYEDTSSHYPHGTYFASVSSANYKVVISFGTRANSLVAVRISTADAQPGTLTYNSSNNTFSIPTSGKLTIKSSSYSIGTISGTYDYANDRLINVRSSNSTVATVINNLTLTHPNNGFYFDCDDKTSGLRNTFIRRYRSQGASSWSTDTGNMDRILSNNVNPISGSSSIMVRPCGNTFDAYGLCLSSDFATAKTVSDIYFWVYNPCDYDITFTAYFYKGTGFSSAEGIGFGSADKAKARSWTYVSRGFGNKNVYNFNLGVWTKDNNTNAAQMSAKLIFDDIFFE